MIRLSTIRELFRYNDWARDRLLGAASALEDGQLDQRFEIGEGSLRATLNHLWAAERVWLDRWLRHESPRYRRDAAGISIERLVQENAELSSQRDGYLIGLGDGGLSEVLTYTNLRGETFSRRIGELALQVCNHGVHHRAQALNMLRRLGVPPLKPELDYIYMYRERASEGPPPLDVETLREYYAYADWARARVEKIAGELRDEQLDQPFPIGPGSVRRTLQHLYDAENWWLENWLEGPAAAFSPIADVPVPTLSASFQTLEKRRNAFLARCQDVDLDRGVELRPRPDKSYVFPRGVSMLQLCCHGTHHRAQIVNMFRQLGAPLPEIDYLHLVMQRENSAARA